MVVLNNFVFGLSHPEPYKITKIEGDKITLLQVSENKEYDFSTKDIEQYFKVDNSAVLNWFEKEIDVYKKSISLESNYFVKTLQQKTLSRLVELGNKAIESFNSQKPNEEWETFKSLIENGTPVYWDSLSYVVIKKPDDYYIKCTLNNHLTPLTINGVLQYSALTLFCK